MKHRPSTALADQNASGGCGLAIAALVAAALSAPATAHAQSAAGQWEYGASIYGWFPSIGGSTAFPPGSGSSGPSLEVTAKDVIDALKMAFFGTVWARKDRWGAFADLVYADLGDTKDLTRDLSIGGVPLPGTATANLSLDLKATALTMAGTYTMSESPAHTANLLFGTRMLRMRERLDYTISGNLGPIDLPTTSGRSEPSQTNWDAIVGVTGNMRFGEGMRWYVPYYLDVGSGQSHLTWQGQIGIGYKFGWGDLVATWRYLDYDFKSGKAIESMSLNGPTIGAVFRW